MSDSTGIEWTDATWNPIRGCSRISEGCRHCYAERVAHRFSGAGMPYEGLTNEHGRWNGTVRVVNHTIDQPLHWRKPRRIFVNSMSDLFHESLPDSDIATIFGIMAAASQHTFQVLTKRAERMAQYFTTRACPPHVWLGVSVENQQAADDRIPHLLRCPAAVRFLSCEPLLGPVALGEEWLLGRFDHCPEEAEDPEHGCEGCPAWGQECNAVRGPRLSWIICGGESGTGARHMEPEWAAALRDRCVSTGTAFFMKQMAKKAPIPLDLQVRQFPAVSP